jgi:hypothetical protein
MSLHRKKPQMARRILSATWWKRSKPYPKNVAALWRSVARWHRAVSGRKK